MAKEDQFGESSKACPPVNKAETTIGTGRIKNKSVRITIEVNKLFEPILCEVRKHLGPPFTPVVINNITEIFFK